MELVYLWVEDYKNIKRQGFNFSPRFECSFDGETLTINEKKEDEYIKDFFGKNINVTAIVGKNGSGKSSILDCLIKLFLYEDLTLSKYIVVFKNKELLYQTNLSNINCDIREKKIEKYDWYSYSFYSRKIDETYEKGHIISLEKHIIAKKLANSFSSNKIFQLSSFMYLPTKIEIESNLDEILMDISAYEFSLNLIPENIASKIQNEVIAYDEEDDTLLNEIEMSDILKNKDELHKFLILLFHFYIHKDILVNRNELIKKYENYGFEPNIKELQKLLEKQTLLLKDISEKEKEFYFSEYHKLFKFDFIDLKKRRYNHLSHGEQVIFGTLLNVYTASLDLENKNIANHFNKRPKNFSIFFILDEPDLSLHPSWQQKYINEIMNLFQKVNSKIYLIFTSHSPFLLSDIPKQNIIFLDTYKQDENNNQKIGNCKVLSHSEVLEKKQTFGANIHTLLSDSFFMENGLMGEFAKDKINNVIKFLKDDKSDIKDKDEARKIIEIIGEPFLKQKLEQIYFKKYPKSNDELIKEYEEKIKELKNANTKNR